MTALNLNALLAILVDQVQALEDATIDTMISRLISHAEDAQLDQIGEIVGEVRAGQNDPDYRAAIRRRIFINNSSGTPEDLLTVMRQITVSLNLEYFEVHPAKARIQTELTVLPVGLQEFMQTLAPAGVDLQIFEGDDLGFRTGRNRTGDRL